MNKKSRLVAEIKDYLMFIHHSKSLIFAFAILTISISSNVSASTNKEWIITYPTLFTDVESMFLDRGCKFTFPLAYIYVPATEQFLPADEAKQLLPGFESILGPTNCERSIKLSKLNSALNLSIAKQDPSVFLFFHTPFDPISGDTFAFTESLKKLIDDRYALASKIKHPVKYLINTPITGLKPQKF